jgi:hypothetical protein
MDHGTCEALNKVSKQCWAKQTDQQAYIKEQEDIIKYNELSQYVQQHARRRIKLAKAAEWAREAR